MKYHERNTRSIRLRMPFMQHQVLTITYQTDQSFSATTNLLCQMMSVQSNENCLYSGCSFSPKALPKIVSEIRSLLKVYYITKQNFCFENSKESDKVKSVYDVRCLSLLQTKLTGFNVEYSAKKFWVQRAFSNKKIFKDEVVP